MATRRKKYIPMDDNGAPTKVRKIPGAHANSVEHKIKTGDKEFLKSLGMTKEQAQKAMREYDKATRWNASAMESWYHREVQGTRGEVA